MILEDGLIKFPTKHNGKEFLADTNLVKYIKNPTDDASWIGFLHPFVETLSELKASQKYKDISIRNIFPRLRMAYMGIIWRDLSIDLVAASLRQREFAKKITHNECNTLDSPVALSQAIARYIKFLLLLKKNEDPSAVHKIDILYRRWISIYAGTLINCLQAITMNGAPNI